MSARGLCQRVIPILSSLTLLQIASAASLGAPAPALAGQASTLRVLIVGNSLSYENNGTYQVVAHLLSQQFPGTAIEAVQIAGSGEFLREHLAKALTPGTYDYAALGPESVEKWDYVILQEESEQVAAGGDSAAASQKAIAGLARLAAARGARVGVVLTWAWLDGKNERFPSFDDMQDKVNRGYVELLQGVRKETGIPVFLAPVGLAWQAVHGVLSHHAAHRHSHNSTRAAAALTHAAEPAAISSERTGTPLAAVRPADAPSRADGSSTVSTAPAPALEDSGSGAQPSAVASFLTVPKARAVTAARQPHEAAAAPDHALLLAICGRRLKAPAPAPDLTPAGTPPAGAPAAAPGLALAGTPPAGTPALVPNMARAGTPPAGDPAVATPAKQNAGAAFGLDWTGVTAGRKLLHDPRLPQSPSSVRHGTGSLSATTGPRLRLLEVAANEPAAEPAAKPAAAAPAPQVAAAAPEKESSGLAATTLISGINATAADAVAAGPVAASATAQGPEVTVPAIMAGLAMRSETFLPARSAAPPSTNPPGQVTVCRVKEYPEGWDTFKEMYKDDGNHPSEQGTYVEALLIASAMTGCRMLGNPFDDGLEAKWVGFLQALSDAVMFQTSPPAFPQHLWAPEGGRCTLK